MIKRYEGQEHYSEFERDFKAVEGGTISPGGAHKVLRCSRQFIYELVTYPSVRAWAYYERIAGIGPWRLYQMEISGDDLIRYAIRVRKWTPSQHMEYIHPRAVEIYEKEYSNPLANFQGF